MTKMSTEITVCGEYSYLSGPINNLFNIPITVGKFCSIARDLTIAGGQHATVDNPRLISQFPFKERLGFDYPAGRSGDPINIGNDVWIGSSVTLLEGVSIGDGAIIGASSVVVRNVRDYAIVAGNPGTIVKWRFAEEIRNKLLAIQWWDWPIEMIQERMPDMLDAASFVNKYYSPLGLSSWPKG